MQRGKQSLCATSLGTNFCSDANVSQAVAFVGFVVLLFAYFPPDGSKRLGEQVEGEESPLLE